MMDLRQQMMGRAALVGAVLMSAPAAIASHRRGFRQPFAQAAPASPAVTARPRNVLSIIKARQKNRHCSCARPWRMICREGDRTDARRLAIGGAGEIEGRGAGRVACNLFGMPTDGFSELGLRPVPCLELLARVPGSPYVPPQARLRDAFLRHSPCVLNRPCRDDRYDLGFPPRRLVHGINRQLL